MCLLINQTSTTPKLTDLWLDDFYDYNSDGVGVMYAENGTLIIEKALPRSAKAFRKFYRKHIEGKTCAFHLRMKTHGNIDLENCHPYEVLNMNDHGMDLWLMHNGILHTGNKADITKSDTWHYIRDYLRPMLDRNPEYAFDPKFAEIIGKHIGDSNKFVLMDNNGRTITINEDAGVYWGGMWLSNTYAWSASTNASDVPSSDPKLAQDQVNEKPSKMTYGTPLMHSYYPDRHGIYPRTEDDVIMDDLYNIIDEMEIQGMKIAPSVSISKCLEFSDYFGSEALYEVAYMALDEVISEDTFLRVINDRKFALETFSWLSDSAYAGGVN